MNKIGHVHESREEGKNSPGKERVDDSAITFDACKHDVAESNGPNGFAECLVHDCLKNSVSWIQEGCFFPGLMKAKGNSKQDSK